MAIETALIKPVVDALMALFRESSDLKLKRDAEKALREAIRELLQANPDENKAQARIAVAKAAGIEMVVAIRAAGGRHVHLRSYVGLQHLPPGDLVPGDWWRDWLFAQHRDP